MENFVFPDNFVRHTPNRPLPIGFMTFSFKDALQKCEFRNIWNWCIICEKAQSQGFPFTNLLILSDFWKTQFFELDHSWAQLDPFFDLSYIISELS